MELLQVCKNWFSLHTGGRKDWVCGLKKNSPQLKSFRQKNPDLNHPLSGSVRKSHTIFRLEKIFIKIIECTLSPLSTFSTSSQSKILKIRMWNKVSQWCEISLTKYKALRQFTWMKLSYGDFSKLCLKMLSDMEVLKFRLVGVDNKCMYLGTTAT